MADPEPQPVTGIVTFWGNYYHRSGLQDYAFYPAYTSWSGTGTWAADPGTGRANCVISQINVTGTWQPVEPYLGSDYCFHLRSGGNPVTYTSTQDWNFYAYEYIPPTCPPMQGDKTFWFKDKKFVTRQVQIEDPANPGQMRTVTRAVLCDHCPCGDTQGGMAVSGIRFGWTVTNDVAYPQMISQGSSRGFIGYDVVQPASAPVTLYETTSSRCRNLPSQWQQQYQDLHPQAYGHNCYMVLNQQLSGLFSITAGDGWHLWCIGQTPNQWLMLNRAKWLRDAANSFGNGTCDQYARQAASYAQIATYWIKPWTSTYAQQQDPSTANWFPSGVVLTDPAPPADPAAATRARASMYANLDLMNRTAIQTYSQDFTLVANRFFQKGRQPSCIMPDPDDPDQCWDWYTPTCMDQPFYWDETVPFEMHPWTIQSSNNAHVDAHGIPSGAIDLVYSTDLHLTARTYYGYPAADGYLTQEQDVAIPGYPIPHACGGQWHLHFSPAPTPVNQ